MWNTDISKAPHGRYDVVARKLKDGKTADHRIFRPTYVWLASKCGVVTLSSYLPDQKRWEMFAAGEKPVAWRQFDPSDTYQEIDPKSGKPATRYRKPLHPHAREVA